MGFPISQLRDDFTDNLVAAAWSEAYQSGSATYAETSGQARFTLPSSTAGTHDAAYYTKKVWDLTASSFYINIQTMVSTSVAATAYFDLVLDDTNYLRVRQLSGTLAFIKTVAGVSTTIVSVTWNATNHKYCRIREASGTVYFDTSTNGTSWTNQGSGANPFAVTDLGVRIGATCGNVASPGSFRLDDVNLILPALTTNWHWTQARWPLTERFKVATIAIDTAGTVQGYITTADTVDASGDPSGNIQYWSGPLANGRELTLCVSQAQAQAMAVDFPLDGRFDLPTLTEARCLRAYHRSIDGNAYFLRELYFRRLIQSDDIEAESIRTINLAASSVTADKILVTELSAITANIGNLTITDKDGQPGWIYQGSGTGDSPTTGLKIFNVAGVGKLSTYNAGTEQVTLDTDGAFKAGASHVVMDATGFNLLGDSGVFADTRALNFRKASDNSIFGQLKAYYGSTNLVEIEAMEGSGDNSSITFLAGGGGTASDVTLIAGDLASSTVAKLAVKSNNIIEITSSSLRIITNTTFVNSTGPRFYKTATGGMVLQAVTGSTYDYAVVTPTGGDIIVVPTGTPDVKLAGKVGFNNTAPIAKPTVTGAKGGNAALGSLLTALANYGLVTDSSSA
jgi:hypothetical protein